jgi:hypothetical protein
MRLALSAAVGGSLGLRIPLAASREASQQFRQPPKVSGPITGGKRGHPFYAYVGDISKRGYVESEYFIEGTATRYQPPASLGENGKWSVTPAGSAPYKTRVVVRYPKDAAKFNGTVIAEWANVSGGFEIAFADADGLYDAGYAYASISAQRVGVHGFETDPAGLIHWDPERYGTLSIPGDSLSYDIYSQVATVLRTPPTRVGLHPLGTLQVRRMIAIGGSQSAARLITYTNAIQPRDEVFDAIMPVTSPGWASGFDDTILDPRKLASMSPAEFEHLRGPRARIRDDLDIPVMIVNSECEAVSYAPVRQPDTKHFRMWEVAGAPHAPKGQMEVIGKKIARDFGPQAAAAMKMKTPSTVMWMPVVEEAIGHTQRWLADGTLPPQQPHILVENGKVVRDQFGNAKGGVRLPDVEVPTASYDGGGFGPGTLGLGGQAKPFSAAQLKQLYPTHKDYVAKVTDAAHAARNAGVIPASREESYIAEATRAPIPG